jgi:plasmid stabilization system protein ParE
MKVYWSKKAKARLREIHDYIAADSPMRAIQVVDRITQRSSLLIKEPRGDRRVPEYMQNDVCEVLERPYRIIYLVGNDRIDIITIKHYRQRLADRPAEL